jgi:hypothetical protein
MAGQAQGRTYGAIPFANSTIGGFGWSSLRPGRLTPGKTLYQLRKGLGGPRNRSGWVRKIFTTPELHPRTVQPIENRYSCYATPATTFRQMHI